MPEPRAPRANKVPLQRLPYAELPVSVVAEQCYCEHRVHLWLKSPGYLVSVPKSMQDKTGPAKAQLHSAYAGEGFHEWASRTELELDIKSKSVRSLVQELGSLQLLEFPLKGRFGTLSIAGIPDAACFEAGKTRCIVEYKFTDSNQLQMSHRVQLQLYGWLLEKNGIEADDVICVCVLVPTQSADHLSAVDAEAQTSLARLVHERARETVESEPDRNNWYIKRFVIDDDFWVRLRIFRYSKAVARSELRFFAPFWHGKRTAIPTTNFRKCSKCLYLSVGQCKVSMLTE